MTGRKIGYTRRASMVAGATGNAMDGEIAQLKSEGCEDVVWEFAAGDSPSLPKELNGLISSLQPGDFLVVTQIDRLGRNFDRLAEVANRINSQSAFLIVGGEIATDHLLAYARTIGPASVASMEARVAVEGTD